MKMEQEFWNSLEQLVRESTIVVHRPKGSPHPKFPDWVCPVDYGYLQRTSSQEREGIGLWVGSNPRMLVDGVLCTVDLANRDSEINILLGCTQEETEAIHRFHNQSPCMTGILIPRP